MEKKKIGFDFLSLSLTAFGGLGIEVLYAFLIEPMLYNAPMQEWNKIQNISHWILTCITWGILSLYLIKTAKHKYDFTVFISADKMKIWQWVSVFFLIIISLAISYINWEGFKIIIEFQRKGSLLFLFQYIYYAFEIVLVLLIIIFGQKGFEVWRGESNIPYGGIVCAVTWGLVHMLTKGSIWVGLNGLLIGLMLGIAYLLVNRDTKRSYLILLLMFII